MDDKCAFLTTHTSEAGALMAQHEDERVIQEASEQAQKAFCAHLNLEYNPKGVADAMLTEIFSRPMVKALGAGVLKPTQPSVSELVPTLSAQTDGAQLATFASGVQTPRRRNNGTASHKRISGGMQRHEQRHGAGHLRAVSR